MQSYAAAAAVAVVAVEVPAPTMNDALLTFSAISAKDYSSRWYLQHHPN
jgi:hypothetical protein